MSSDDRPPFSASGELVDQAASVICPTCGARPGHRCTDLAGRPAPGVLSHRARAQVWRASRVADELSSFDDRAAALFASLVELVGRLNDRIREVDEGTVATLERIAEAHRALSDRVAMLELDRKGDQQ